MLQYLLTNSGLSRSYPALITSQILNISIPLLWIGVPDNPILGRTDECNPNDLQALYFFVESFLRL